MKVRLTKVQVRQRLQKETYLEMDNGKFVLINNPMVGLGQCFEFVTSVLAGGYEFNSLVANKRRRTAYHKALSLVLPIIQRCREFYVPGWVYHPSITFISEQHRIHPISCLSGTESPVHVLDNGMTVQEVFLDFIRKLKSEAAAQGLRKNISDHDAKLKKNLKRLRLWEKELFRRCSRPVIIRLDLDYLASLFSNDDFRELLDLEARELLLHDKLFLEGASLEARDLPAMRVSLETVQRDRARLFENMKGKPSLFRHLVGSVWRYEYGHRAGFHLHLLLAFDGSKVRKHQWLAQKIGEYWADDITEGRGRFHNCNADWDEHAPTYGIGRIEWHNERLRGNLVGFVLPYLAKFDQYVLARPYRGCKLMGSGFAHRAQPVGLGRPRKAVHQRHQPPARPAM